MDDFLAFFAAWMALLIVLGLTVAFVTQVPCGAYVLGALFGPPAVLAIITSQLKKRKRA